MPHVTSLLTLKLDLTFECWMYLYALLDAYYMLSRFQFECIRLHYEIPILLELLCVSSNNLNSSHGPDNCEGKLARTDHRPPRIWGDVSRLSLS